MQKENIATPNKEMIVIPLEEYKELISMKGRVISLENEVIRTHETLGNFIKLQSLVFSHEVRV